MQKQTTYQQLQPDNRIKIASMRQRGIGMRAIARRLERQPSTIARELARNTTNASQVLTTRNCVLQPVAAMHMATANSMFKVRAGAW